MNKHVGCRVFGSAASSPRLAALAGGNGAGRKERAKVDETVVAEGTATSSPIRVRVLPSVCEGGE